MHFLDFGSQNHDLLVILRVPRLHFGSRGGPGAHFKNLLNFGGKRSLEDPPPRHTLTPFWGVVVLQLFSSVFFSGLL